MGCSSSRPVPQHRPSMGNSESTDYTPSQTFQEESAGSQENGNPRVHWGDDDDDEEEDDDYMTEYNTDMSSTYRLRAMSSKGPRSAGGRSVLTTTTAGETFEGSEYFDM